MNDDVSMAFAEFPEMLGVDGRVAADLPCVVCGYNVRTQPGDGICPECATPIVKSLQRGLLRFASPPWVRTLARGARLILIALGIGFILGPLVQFIASFLFFASAPPAGLSVFWGLQQIIFGLVPLIMGIVGVVWLTRRAPGEDEPAGMTARKLTRVAICAAAVVLLIGMAGSFVMLTLINFPTGPTPATNPAQVFQSGAVDVIQFVMLTMVASLAIFMVVPLALLTHLIRLLKRCPVRHVVTLARVTFWGLLISAIPLIIGYGALALAMGPIMQTMMTPPPATAPATRPTTAPATMPTTMPGKWQVTVGVAPGGPQVTLSPNVPTTMPAAGPNAPPMPMPAPPMVGGFMSVMGAGFCGGCGTVVFGILFISTLVRACMAFFAEAREGERIGMEGAGT